MPNHGHTTATLQRGRSDAERAIATSLLGNGLSCGSSNIALQMLAV